MPSVVDLLGVLSCGRVLSLAVRSTEIGPFSARSHEAPCCWQLFFASFRSRLIGCVDPSQFICVKKKNKHEVPSYYGSRANNTTLGVRIGSIIFGKSPTYQPVTNLSEYFAKPVPCQSDSYSKQEPNVKTLWPDIKMMVSPMKLTVPSATPKQLSRSANPNHLKTEKSESNLHRCGRDCLAPGGAENTRCNTHREQPCFKEQLSAIFGSRFPT